MATRFELSGELFDLTPTPKHGLPLGARISGSANATKRVTFSLPGIMSVTWMPTVGISTNGGSPINVASQRVFKQVQNALKNRTLGFQRTDLIVNITCNDSIHILYEDIARAYKASVTTNKFNRYYAETLLTALGYDYTSFLDNRADIRTSLTRWRRVLEMYPLPDILNYVGIHNEMASSLYLDTVSDKAQMYAFVPAKLFTYERVDTGYGKGLEYVDVHGTSPKTWPEIKSIMENMILAMTNSTDFDIISAALLSTFESSLVVPVNVPGDDEELVPTTNAYFDNAMLNAVLVGSFNNMGGANLAPQDDGNNNLVTPAFSDVPVTGVPLNSGNYINALTDTPTSVEMANYMRWHPAFVHDSINSAVFIDSCGTEILLEGMIYNMHDIEINGDADFGGTRVSLAYNMGEFNDVDSNNRNLMYKIFLLSAFKNHPIAIAGVRNAADNYSYYLPITQWNYIAEVPDVKPYHEAILWYAFAEHKSSAAPAPTESDPKPPRK